MPDMVKVRRPSNNQFAQEPRVNIGRSQFNRSHGLKTTFDASYLVPIYVDEVLPGDTFTCKLNGFCRLFSPLDAPIMDNIELETFFFYVPTRLLWQNWEAFNGAHDAAGAQDTDYTVPIIADAVANVDHDGNNTSGALFAAYMGLPHGLDFSETPVNALPFRAYKKIYNEWFRDQNLIGEATETVDNGPDIAGDMGTMEKSAKRHDYFTSCLPYLQKGDAVTVALSGLLPVEMVAGIGGDVPTIIGSLSGTYHTLDADGSTVDLSIGAGGGASDRLEVDAGLASLNINALRQSVAIQRLLEKDARGGTRYTEYIKSHFGVTSPDFRLQRSEYLGGGKSFINVSPVANTSDTTGGQIRKQGELSGIGTGIIQGHGWAKSFVEHGYIIGIVRARADLTYFQGLDKLWSRSTRYDFYIPSLANLGEQSVLNKEIWVSNVPATDIAVFGYQERWSEYRFKKSMITGTFNPDITGSLSHWHLAEDFSSLPSLNAAFVEDQTPMSRVVTITTEHDFLLDLWFDLKCARPMPVHSIPSLIGSHF